MKKVNFEVFCEQCGAAVELDKAMCSNCHSRLGDLECPNCGYVGTVSAFENGCPKCGYSPFEEQVKERSFKRRRRVEFRRTWNSNFLKSRFYFGFNVSVMLYLFASFLIVLLFVYILFF
ncbi:zinc ribbon domain-containing protein [Borrelia coriaceae]|uniref:zinc ribbon domain-containing protein n=1 Tax=Borrelia coriaceae TaxID=144 RepID=UPI00046D145D|nr:zinc ribbon domain-containing protein [Borrelia coriaceae]UPA16506.1 zinc ribbon domain-containing protein [Borrelia coriaceae]